MRASDDLIAEIDSVLAAYGSDPADPDAMTDAEKVAAVSKGLNQRGPAQVERSDTFKVGAATQFAKAKGGTEFPLRRHSRWLRFWTKVGNWITG